MTSPQSVRSISSRMLHKLLLICAVVWFVTCIVVFSEVEPPLVPFFLCLGGGIGLFLGWLLLVARATQPQTSEVTPPVQRRHASFVLVPLLLFLALLFLNTSLLLHVRVKLSEPALVRYVHAVDTDPNVGLFRIRAVERRNDVVWLITTTCGFGNTCGLVYSPHEVPPDIDEDSYHHLTGPWWKWRRSW